MSTESNNSSLFAPAIKKEIAHVELARQPCTTFVRCRQNMNTCQPFDGKERTQRKKADFSALFQKC